MYVRFCCFDQTLEMLEKKENFLCRKAAAEFDKAKEYTRGKKKHGTGLCFLDVVCLRLDLRAMRSPEFVYLFVDAIRCLKKKRMYERQVEQLVSYQSRVHDQVIAPVFSVKGPYHAGIG